MAIPNLVQKYKDTLVTSLVKTYTKACFLKEFYFIFPYIEKLKFNNETSLFWQYAKSILLTKYFNQLPGINISFFDLVGTNHNVDAQIDAALSSIIIELNNNSRLESFSVSQDMLSILKTYPCEFRNELDIIDEEKYSKDNLFLEIYFRLGASAANPEDVSQMELQNRSSDLYGVINFDALKQFLAGIDVNDEDFFAVIPSIKYGIRLVFNPNLIVPTVQLANLLADPYVFENKTNLIIGAFSAQEEKQKHFPIVLCKSELDLLAKLPDVSLSSLREYLDSRDSDTLFRSLKLNFHSSEEYLRLFQYVFPVEILELILISNLRNTEALIGTVYAQNSIYQNLSTNIITMIDHLMNADDPRRL